MTDEQCTVILVDADGNETVAYLGAGGTQVTGTRDHCRAFVDRHRAEHPQYESRNNVKFEIRCT
ncbi:hypothetical protein DMB66_18465 [Actinoplanes sp. ATCC 53533]|uniref:hypothetical protein n=1 Tax=Actinoplanes sp. ATCC 53533 TaxID=1288362 RepID=UPI000F77B67A|nr:hypothetical protein [Actinoplanes sp. ATCC 53533]RSM64898.1 hypothetical protein DMB66_18465 [Actinoplanes sp. ATCC 53533]